MALAGERTAEARELESIEHSRWGASRRNSPRSRRSSSPLTAWAPLVPKAASIRGGNGLLIDERYDLDRDLLPRTTAALGPRRPARRRGLRAADGQPDRRRSGPASGRSSGSAGRPRPPGRWLEQTTPFRAAAALTFLLSMGQTVVVVPIAVATVGPLAAAVSIFVIGLLAISATAAVAEAATRSGEVRFRGGFFGRLVIGGLGPDAGVCADHPRDRGVVLPTVSALVGLGLPARVPPAAPAVVWGDPREHLVDPAAARPRSAARSAAS